MAHARQSVETIGLLGQAVFFVAWVLVFLHPFGLAEMLSGWLFSWFAMPNYLNTSDEFRGAMTFMGAILIYGPMAMAGIFVAGRAWKQRRPAQDLTVKWYDRPAVRNSFIVLAITALAGWLWIGTWETLATLPDPNVNQSASWAAVLFLAYFGAFAWITAAGWSVARLARIWMPAGSSGQARG